MINGGVHLQVRIVNRGTFRIKRIATAEQYAEVTGVAKTTIPSQASTTEYVDVQITEPLLLSPFIFGSPENKQGFFMALQI